MKRVCETTRCHLHHVLLHIISIDLRVKGGGGRAAFTDAWVLFCSQETEKGEKGG